MFLKRSSSFHGSSSKSGTSSSSSSSPLSVMSPSSPLRIWRRKHRRSQSADDAHNANAAAVANAAAAQIKAEQEELLRLQRTELQLGKLLGEGGFARVFSVTVNTAGASKHQRSFTTTKKRKLALKQLRPELMQDKTLFSSAAKAMVQESRIMAQLKGHPHILQLRGVSAADNDNDDTADQVNLIQRGFDSFFLVTDALRETMTDRLRSWQENPTSSRKVLQQRWNHQLQYALQTAKALAYCHEQGIIFRDCKVDNLGFSDEHTVQLFDFGMARELPSLAYDSDGDDDAQTCTLSLDEEHGGEELFHMTICGTQRHMAPEVYNRGWYNLKADTYSWAMTVVELITGKKPYPFMSLPVHKILVLEGGGRPNVDAFPVGLQAILQQAWAENINERWTMAQTCAALETYIGSSDCRQYNPTTSTTTATSTSTSKTTATLQDQARKNNLQAMQKQQQQPSVATSNKSILASAA